MGSRMDFQVLAREVGWTSKSVPHRESKNADGPGGPSYGGEAEVKLDYVGSLENAAIVISRLHRGEKRLVFVDSRARAEELGAELRQLNVTAFVTHSSLSQEPVSYTHLTLPTKRIV